MPNLPKKLPGLPVGYELLTNNTVKKTIKSTFAEKLEVKIGDEKQTDFLPRLKIEKWDNECNLSVGIVTDNIGATVKTEGEKIVWEQGNTIAEFYDIPPTIEAPKVFTDTQTVRLLSLDKVDPSLASSEYEIFEHLENIYPLAVTWRPKSEVIFMYGRQSAKSFYNTETLPIPLSRLRTKFHANPIYSNENIPWLDIHFGLKLFQSLEEAKQKVFDSVSTVLKRYGIENIFISETSQSHSLKLTFEKEGIRYKFSNFVFSDRRIFGYLNLGGDYAKSKTLYKEGVVDRFRETGTNYGKLWELNDQVPVSVIDEVAKEIIVSSGRNWTSDTFSQQENTTLAGIAPLVEEQDYIIENEREDFLSENRKEGGYEFEIVLKEKPLTNQITLSIETKELEFYYQPKLTLEEKEKGAFSPIDIIGSYAAYYRNHPPNYVGDRLYQTGKAFHIFRPRIEDSARNWVWGELDIDTTSGTLRVTIPQDFLDKAVYPVRHAAGLTFGSTADAATEGFVIYYHGIGSDNATGAAGTGTSMSSRFTASATNVNTQMYLYDSTLAKVTNGVTNENTNPTASLHWETQNFTSAPTLTAQTYTMCLFCEGSGPPYGTWLIFYYDTSAGHTANNYTVTETYPTWPASLYGGLGESNRRYGIYVTYTAGGGATAQPPYLTLLGAG